MIFELQGFTHELQNKDLKRYRVAVSIDQQDYPSDLEKMSGERLDHFLKNGIYREWHTAERSCLLILSGHNIDDSILTQC